MDTFYEENQENIKMLKHKMSLDFNMPASHSKKAKLYKTCILESPDLKMLKLASPELERMIIQQNGLVTTTPTPSLGSVPYGFLKQEPEATEEQEQFSRGFVDALNQLHQTNGQHQQHPTQHPPQHCLTNNTNHNSNINSNQNNSHSNCNSNNNQNSNNNSSETSSDLTIADTHSPNRRTSYHMLVPASVGQTTGTATTNTKFAVPEVPTSQVSTTASSSAANNTTEQYVSVSSCQTTGAHVLINTHNSVLPPYSEAVHNTNQVYPMSVKIEDNHREGSPMPVHTSLAQPIDMEDQERIKLERKRQRNRVAASKCRRRKLERISKLEDKVKGLKGENSELSIVVSKLRDQVMSLKQQVMGHVKCGCQIRSSH